MTMKPLCLSSKTIGDGAESGAHYNMKSADLETRRFYSTSTSCSGNDASYGCEITEIGYLCI